MRDVILRRVVLLPSRWPDQLPIPCGDAGACTTWSQIDAKKNSEMSKRTAGLKAKGARREVGGNARSKAQPGVGVRKGHTSTQENRAPGQNFYRDNNTVRRLQMYNSKPDRAKMRQEALAPVRIEPGERKPDITTENVRRTEMVQQHSSCQSKQT